MIKLLRNLLRRTKKARSVVDNQVVTDSALVSPALPAVQSPIDFLEKISSGVVEFSTVGSYPIAVPDNIGYLRMPFDDWDLFSPNSIRVDKYPNILRQQPFWPSAMVESSIDWWNTASNEVSVKNPYLYEKYEPVVPSLIYQFNLYENEFKNFKKDFLNELLYLFETELFEYGIDNKADTYVAEWLATNPSLTKEWLNSLYNDCFSDASVLTKILRIIGRIEYQVISPQGPTMAALVLNHKNAEVQEAAIRAFESWGSLESLKYLLKLRSELKFADKWVKDYVDEVIFYLKEDLNVPPSKED